MNTAYLLDKLYSIDKALGGTAHNKNDNSDPFQVYKDKAMALSFQFKKKTQEKEKKGYSADSIRIALELKDIVNDSEAVLMKMNEILREQQKDKKYGRENIDLKHKIYENLRQQIKDMQSLIDSEQEEPLTVPQTLTEQRAQLLGDVKVNSSGGPKKKNQEVSEEERAAMERWKEQDKAMDQKMDVIIDGLGQWSNKAKVMGQKIDDVAVKIQKLDVEVDKTNAELTNQNAQLKKILIEYRKPDKFCLDMVFLIIIFALIYVIYKYAKG